MGYDDYFQRAKMMTEIHAKVSQAQQSNQQSVSDEVNRDGPTASKKTGHRSNCAGRQEEDSFKGQEAHLEEIMKPVCLSLCMVLYRKAPSLYWKVLSCKPNLTSRFNQT